MVGQENPGSEQKPVDLPPRSDHPGQKSGIHFRRESGDRADILSDEEESVRKRRREVKDVEGTGAVWRRAKFAARAKMSMGSGLSVHCATSWSKSFCAATACARHAFEQCALPGAALA